MKHFRQIVWLSMVLLSLLSCRRGETYTIHGNLRCVRDRKAYLMELTEQGTPIVVDSAVIHAGEFRFRGHVDYPTMRFIRIGTRPPFDVFVENSDIKVSGSMSLPEEITVSGSFSHDDFNSLAREYKRLKDRQSTVLVHLSNARTQRNYKEVSRLTKVYNTYPDSLLWMTKQFVLNNPSSMGAAYFVCVLSQSQDITKLEEIISLFDASIQQSPYVQYLHEELALHQNFSVGMEAPDFAMPTFLGDTIGLRNYDGKYLFIDFGASWCDATKQRIEWLKELYERHEEQEFEVLSVFLDEDKKEWRSYVTSLGVLPWRLACDFKYWSSPISKYYRVQALPYGVLIDSEGKIALINPSKRDLENYLKKKLK